MLGRSTFLAAALILGLIASDLGATEALRVATYNIQEVGTGTQLTALTSVIKRVDADVVFLQEVKSAENQAVANLAASTGYGWHAVSNTSGTLSGGLKNAVLSRYPIGSTTSWSAAMASGDPNANDITRDIFQVELSVPEAGGPVGLFTVHLKASTGSKNDFRRAIELLRVKQVVELYLSTHPNANVFFGGDLNEDVGDGPFGVVFNSQPSGLPTTYSLGKDITFPVVYDPFNFVGTIGGLGLEPVDATQEDSLADATRAASGRRLDYIFVGGGVAQCGDEVYGSPNDNGIDDAPLGLFLEKNGTPLSSGTSSLASDHYTVFTDLVLESANGARYGAGYPGDHLLTPHAGIRGGISVGSADFGMRALYGRPNSVAILVLGRSRLAPPYGYSLNPYVPGAFLHVMIAGMYGMFTLVTDSEGAAELAIPLPPDPLFVGRQLNMQWFITDPAGPNGVGSMTDGYEIVIQP